MKMVKWRYNLEIFKEGELKITENDIRKYIEERQAVKAAGAE